MAAHSVFTIVTRIIPGCVAELQEALNKIQADIDEAYARPRSQFDFRQLPKLHFASFVIFDDKTEPLLVFENSVDDSAEDYLGELMSWLGPGMDDVYKHCDGYPVQGSPAAKLEYLEKNIRWPQLHHVGTAYRTVRSIVSDRQLRQQLDARVDSLASKLSPEALWRQLQCEFPMAPGREGRAWERIKNWTTMLSPIPALAVVIALLWERPYYLVGFLALVFALKAMWLATLVGWPRHGNFKPALWFVPAAVAGGAFLGLWPSRHPVPMYTAIVVLGTVAAFLIGRALPVRQARQTRGNWPVIPMVALAAALSWLLAVVSQRIQVRLHVDLPMWLDVLAAVIGFIVIFVGLVFTSAMPASRRLPAVRYAIIVVGGGVGALLFWIVADIDRWWHAPGALILAAVSLMELFALWDIPLPSPEIAVPPISRPDLKKLELQEDKDVQNHMAVMVQIREHRSVRAFLLKFFLHTLDLVFYRTVLPDTWYRSSLFGISTVHFAQWTVLDNTRHMFLSNYDLSWSVYLNDFGERLTSGIQKIWGQSEGCPGTDDLEKFKQFVRTRMVPYQVWYRAYPGLTASQIQNNEQLRLGLAKTQIDEKTSAELLRRLSHIERT